MTFIDEFLSERGYRIETHFLRTMESMSIVLGGLATRTFVNIPSNPRFGTFNQPERKDDDKRMYSNFQPRMGIATNVRGERIDLFCSKDHKRTYSKLLKREVMNPRSVDFDFLDSVKVNLRKKLALLQLK